MQKGQSSRPGRLRGRPRYDLRMANQVRETQVLKRLLAANLGPMCQLVLLGDRHLFAQDGSVYE